MTDLDITGIELLPRHLLVAGGLGWFLGGYAMLAYLKWTRALRTRHEWYADPKVSKKYGPLAPYARDLDRNTPWWRPW